jgi:hypothetical protein
VGDTTFTNVLIGVVLFAGLVVLLALEFAFRPAVQSRRPLLPPDDRPPAIPPQRSPVLNHEIKAEVDRGYAAIAAYLRGGRNNRHG